MFVAYICLPVCTIGCMVTIFYSGVDFSNILLPRVLMTIFFVCMLLSNILVFYAFQRYTEGLYKESEHQIEIMHQRAEIYRLNQITEMNDKYKMKVLCEPQLGKRGLYPTISQKGSYDEIEAMTNFIAYADGKNDLVDISNTINVSVRELTKIIGKLQSAELI